MTKSIPALLRNHNLYPRKRLGQNFLTDPVALERILAAADLSPDDTVIEVGAGLGTLTRPLAEQASLILAKARLERFGGRVRLFQANFADVDEVLTQAGEGPVDALLADLGIASMQLDDPERGLSFQAAGPLDMRLGPDTEQTAADPGALIAQSAGSTVSCSRAGLASNPGRSCSPAGCDPRLAGTAGPRTEDPPLAGRHHRLAPA